MAPMPALAQLLFQRLGQPFEFEAAQLIQSSSS